MPILALPAGRSPQLVAAHPRPATRAGAEGEPSYGVEEEGEFPWGGHEGIGDVQGGDQV